MPVHSGGDATGGSLDAESLGGASVRLSELLRETTAALGRLDVEALERLAAQAERLPAGGGPLNPEPVERVASEQRVLGSMLAATARNLAVLRRRQDRQHEAR